MIRGRRAGVGAERRAALAGGLGLLFAAGFAVVLVDLSAFFFVACGFLVAAFFSSGLFRSNFFL